MNVGMRTLAAAAILPLSLSMGWATVGAWQPDKPFPGELSGLDQSELLTIDDDQPLAANQSFLMRLLYRARRTPADLWNDYLPFTSDLNLADVAQAPRQYRGWVFHVQGTATQVHRIDSGDRESNGIQEYFLVRMQTDSGLSFAVCALAVPHAWLDRPSDLRECADLIGFFALRSPPSTGLEPELMFVTRRIAWRPAKDSERLGDRDDLWELAQAGLDLGLLDIPRQTNLKPLTESDSESFYALLRAANQIRTAAEIPSNDSAPLSFLDLVRNPAANIGRKVQFEARIRRAVSVGTDPVQAQTGLASFDQLDGFFPLGDTPIEVTDLAGQRTLYQSQFPVTIDVAQAPGTARQYELQRVRVTGYFYRFWSYESEFTADRGAGAGQLAPLIIATNLEILPAQESEIAWITIPIFLAAAAAVIAVAWVIYRQPRTGRPLPSLPDKLPF